MSFFENLNFASSNEDGRSELAGLAGTSGRLVCITGSGTRPLDMLLSDAKTVVAIDMNPAQNALLRLKIAAIGQLDHGELLAFLGITSGDRMALWQRVRTALSVEDAQYWDARLKMIKRGVWYAGLWERVLRFGAKGTRLIRGRQIEALFDAPDVETQGRIWAQKFDDWIWRSSIRMLGRPWVWTRVIGEPGGAFLPSPDQVEQRLAGAFNRASNTFLFRESDFASLILRGTSALPSALPLHLLAENYDTVRARLDRLDIRLAGLHELDETVEADGFSLSDFGSYTTPDTYADAWRGVMKAARPNARFVERVFMNPLPLPFDALQLDEDMSSRLTAADRAIIYDIRAGRIAT
ncbi:DUF3419 family protein [Amylibacter sp. IMCC11727]|uniref:DUF3419 family protein n=1 Tax=Amylibacter sp. IMCC11727 TaxID=3039851 RepID=UPI00244E477D|nr:DUF3419 family protein [Amylibacter sp. IMCC11727]WGI23273.1 DUF3419 family protein [Amylibacter sp. IMCC11727]